MTKYLLYFILFGLLSSCTPTPIGTKTTQTDANYTIKVIDGCEYIEYDYGFGAQRVYSLTHKGNCRNPIHYSNYVPPVIPVLPKTHVEEDTQKAIDSLKKQKIL